MIARLMLMLAERLLAASDMERPEASQPSACPSSVFNDPQHLNTAHLSRLPHPRAHTVFLYCNSIKTDGWMDRQTCQGPPPLLAL